MSAAFLCYAFLEVMDHLIAIEKWALFLLSGSVKSYFTWMQWWVGIKQHVTRKYLRKLGFILEQTTAAQSRGQLHHLFGRLELPWEVIQVKFEKLCSKLIPLNPFPPFRHVGSQEIFKRNPYAYDNHFQRHTSTGNWHWSESEAYSLSRPVRYSRCAYPGIYWRTSCVNPGGAYSGLFVFYLSNLILIKTPTFHFFSFWN